MTSPPPGLLVLSGVHSLNPRPTPKTDLDGKMPDYTTWQLNNIKEEGGLPNFIFSFLLHTKPVL